MKVGILTYHHTTNYGATLQAYALQKAVKSRGHSGELIDYRPVAAVRFYRKDIYPIRASKHWLRCVAKSWKMARFLRSQTQLSRDKAYTRDNIRAKFQHYDAVIAGSDEVWKIKSVRGYDPSYFLDFIYKPNTLKISYAPSFGNLDALGAEREEICRLIHDFDSLSVRDTNSLQLLKNECNKQATRVLDPTFLTNYEDILLKPRLKKDYLLIYYETRLKKEQESFIKEVARIKKLTIVSIGYYNQVADINLVGVSPQEWLGYFANASYVITNFFHGTVFSIIFRKPFTVFSNKYKVRKVLDLLNHLGLGDRIILAEAESELVPDNYLEIDYSPIIPKLDLEIQKSQDFLSTALSSNSASTVQEL
ncbi:polysaccharide pyruvyl transferase family protein [Leptolyngbya sp. FACHB-541]|uniref:polysaccharide pyruvyl transferase family protein n=1 Tax=Leptolyngbya sp. FACHB-541 TaxID=2692810 RepID=UPI001689C5A9|nr:polysaccharide pyruvyl transferase family protein [Leptolyngbya sp. FACHB-541]MBD1997010.1 polysaccharide pyruvyl transferase family protein [Leptolyngbya sp. FACHB-541]